MIMLNFSELMAISPLDGRYVDKLINLRPIFSEYGLIRFRVFVEVRWLQALLEYANLPELPKLSKKANDVLNDIIEDFGEDSARRVKAIEDKINHDVKAVEYFIKERMEKNAELGC